MYAEGHRLRCREAHRLLSQASCCTRLMLERINAAFCRPSAQAKPEPPRILSVEQQQGLPLSNVALGCAPAFGALIVFAPETLLGLPVLIAIQVFLWWVLLGPLKRAPSSFRKLFKIMTITGVVVDLAAVVGWAMRDAPRGMRIGLGLGTSLFVAITMFWWIAFFWIIFSGRKRRRGALGNRAGELEISSELRVPGVRFVDVGGMSEAKERIREVVESRLDPEKYARYGVLQNGILLYGPRGSGKTFLAEATAGEFGLSYHYISPTQLMSGWVAQSEANIRGAFERALAHCPALLFIDEIDALGSARQTAGESADPGGGGRAYNNMTIELMQSIDKARTAPRFVLMAATNVIEGLDEALVRDGRFDVKIHVDLPDEATRERMFEAQLRARPWRVFGLRDFARRTPGASGAKIRSLVERAAMCAAREGRKIEARDLQKALEEYGGKDRPLFQPVGWEDLIIGAEVERELRALVRLVDHPYAAEQIGLKAPMGILLLGAPGTGKTMIARLIATQSKRSFLPITSADVTGPKGVSRAFARARENSPSLVFLDEMDGLVPANEGYLAQHYVQIVEQFLIEIGNLLPEHNVLLVGATNHPDRIDGRMLRGGRFSEKIEIGPPGPAETPRLLDKYLAGAALEPAANAEFLAVWLEGVTPANLEAMIVTAKRYAFERSGFKGVVPLSLEDLERAAARIMGQAPPLPPSAEKLRIVAP